MKMNLRSLNSPSLLIRVLIGDEQYEQANLGRHIGGEEWEGNVSGFVQKKEKTTFGIRSGLLIHFIKIRKLIDR